MSQKAPDIAEVIDLPLSLSSEAFRRYLSIRHIAQLVTHGKTVKIAKSVLQILLLPWIFQENALQKNCPPDNCPLKNYFTKFLLLLTLSYGYSFPNVL